jgi:hypothetical protein
VTREYAYGGASGDFWLLARDNRGWHVHKMLPYWIA